MVIHRFDLYVKKTLTGIFTFPDIINLMQAKQARIKKIKKKEYVL